MKSNGRSPDRYAVYITETHIRAVEVVAESPDEARKKAHDNYVAGLYSRNNLVKEKNNDPKDWHVSRIEGCC